MKRIKHSPWLLRARDQIIDVSIELSSRLSRTILMIAAVAFSTGALLASVGISQNAAHQVDADIAASTSRLVVLSIANKSQDETATSESAIDEDAMDEGAMNEARHTVIPTVLPDGTIERLRALDNVEDAGFRLDVDTSALNQFFIDYPTTGATNVDVGLKAVTSGYFNAASIESTGTLSWMLDGSEHVAFLGEHAAETLGIPVTSNPEALSVNLNNVNYSIIGFLPGNHAFTNSLVIPYINGLSLVGNDRDTQVLIRTAIGAGNQVSKAARLAVLPGMPEKLTASQVVLHENIRQSVSDQLTRQVAWIGGFLIVLTVLLITNSMIVSVTARTTEIGVRRALGSSRSSVAGVFWFEGALVGALGGLAGAALSSIVVTVVAMLNSWTAYLNPVWIAAGPLLGLSVGVLASLYPALRASAVHPAIAVRSD